MSDLTKRLWGVYHDEAYTQHDGEFVAAFSSPELCEYTVRLHNKQLEQDNGEEPDRNL